MHRRLLLASAVLAAFVVTAGADVYIGDSIALGAGHTAHRPTYARERMGSCWIARHVPRGLTGRVIVSAGVNDEGRCTPAVRTAVGSRARVIWIVPPWRYGLARQAMFAIGVVEGDAFVTFVPGPDGLHPRSYQELARAVAATR